MGQYSANPCEYGSQVVPQSMQFILFPFMLCWKAQMPEIIAWVGVVVS